MDDRHKPDAECTARARALIARAAKGVEQNRGSMVPGRRQTTIARDEHVCLTPPEPPVSPAAVQHLSAQWSALATRPDSAPLGPRRVLIVEDNPLSRNALRFLLERQGHQVDVAATGPEAVRVGVFRPPGKYRDMRDKWVHEDNLINHRVTWLHYSQTLLFAVYGVLMTVTPPSEHLEKAKTILRWLPWFGILVTCLIFLAVAGAVIAQCTILADVKAESKPYVRKWLTQLGYVPPLALHLLFIASWLFVRFSG